MKEHSDVIATDLINISGLAWKAKDFFKPVAATLSLPVHVG